MIWIMWKVLAQANMVENRLLAAGNRLWFVTIELGFVVDEKDDLNKKTPSVPPIAIGSSAAYRVSR